MNKYRVVAEIVFDVYDEDEFSAERQGRIAALRLVKSPLAQGYEDEYADTPVPSLNPARIRVLDEDGNLLVDNIPVYPKKFGDTTGEEEEKAE